MNKPKPIKMPIPTRIYRTISEIDELNNYSIDLFFIIYSLLVSFSHNKEFRKKGYAQLYKEKLAQSLNCSTSTIDRRIKLLTDYSLLEIEVKKEKSVMKDPNYYRIYPDFLESAVTYFELTPKYPLFRSLVERGYNDRAHLHRFEPHIKEMSNQFIKNFKFDLNAALEYIEKKVESKLRFIYAVIAIRFSDPRFRYFNISKVNGRINTNLTNLPRVLRRFIIGKRVSIDASNLQPFLLSFVLEEINKIIGMLDESVSWKKLKKWDKKKTHNKQLNKVNALYPHTNLLELANNFGTKALNKYRTFLQNEEYVEMVESSNFKKDVLDGKLYEKMIEGYFKLTGKLLLREETKNIVIKVLFSQNVIKKGKIEYVSYQKEKEIFATIYPGILERVQILKSKDHRILPNYLTKIESDLFIKKISKALYEAGITNFSTIHDSVQVFSVDEEKTIEIMAKIFKEEIGYIPHFKKEIIGHEPLV